MIPSRNIIRKKRIADIYLKDTDFRPLTSDGSNNPAFMIRSSVFSDSEIKADHFDSALDDLNNGPKPTFSIKGVKQLLQLQFSLFILLPVATTLSLLTGSYLFNDLGALALTES